MPSTRSSNTKPKSFRPFTTSKFLAKAPTGDPAPLSHGQSIAKEIDTTPSIQSPKNFQTVIDHNKSRLNSLDLFDKASSVSEKSSADEEAAESVSDFFDYPDGSTTGIKSPYSGSRSERLQATPTTEKFSPDFGHDGRSRRGSESIDGSIVFSELYGRRKSSEVSRQADWNPGEPIQDSPTVGRHLTASMRRLKSSTIEDEKTLMSPASPNFSMSHNSPNPTINSIVTTSTSARAENGLFVPFLPRFLRVLGSPRESEASPEPEAVKEAPNKSVFEDESSDDDDEDAEEITEIHEARLGVVGRPVLVHQGSSTLVGLKDMLRSGPVPSIIHPPPSLASHSAPGPSTTKVARLLGHEVIIRADPISSVAQSPPSSRLRSSPGPSTAKAAQILGHEVQVRNRFTGSPEHQGPITVNTETPNEAKEKSNDTGSLNSEGQIAAAWTNDDGLGSWRNPVSSLADGLRSNPVLAIAKMHRSASVPSRRKQQPAVPGARTPPLAPAPFNISPPLKLVEAVTTDQDHYIQVVEERLQTTMEELGRLKLELGSLKRTIGGPKSPRRSKSSRIFNGLFRRTGPCGSKWTGEGD